MAESAWYSWAAGVPVTILEIDQASTALAGQADMGAVTLASPTANPGAISATVLSESGNLNGAYQYVLTETMGAIDGHGNLHPAGQTAAGTASNVVNASDNPVALTLPAPSALAISRTIWRTTGGGSTFYFLVTIVNPQISAWTDNVADADLGTTEAPTVNTTGTVLQLPVFPAIPAFSANPGTMIAVTVASGTTVLYRSTGSGWLPVPDLDVANTWTTPQTFDKLLTANGNLTLPSGTPATGAGVLSQEDNALYIGNGTEAVAVVPVATASTVGTVEVSALPASGNPVVGSIVASAVEMELTTTTATTLATYTPSVVGAYRVRVFYRIVTAATTITLAITYTDAGGTAQTDTLVNAVSQAIGDYEAEDLVVSGASDALSVSMTAGTASQTYATAIVEGV